MCACHRWIQISRYRTDVCAPTDVAITIQPCARRPHDAERDSIRGRVVESVRAETERVGKRALPQSRDRGATRGPLGRRRCGQRCRRRFPYDEIVDLGLTDPRIDTGFVGQGTALAPTDNPNECSVIDAGDGPARIALARVLPGLSRTKHGQSDLATVIRA